MSWQILVADPIDSKGLDILRREAQVIESKSLDGLGTVDALIVRSATQVTEQVLVDGRPRLQVVGRAGVGVDNIDLNAAKANNVTVVNAPLAITDAVAEHVLALMLSLARHLPAADRSMRQGRWDKGQFKGRQLSGRTLGIIGVGRIGAAVARRASALGMRVIGFDSLIPPQEIRSRGVEPVELDEVLSQADVLSLHVPLTRETQGLIGTAALAKMKPTGYVINTSRGGVIDESALWHALQEGRIAGAGLDVFEHEPPDRLDLIQHENVVATPHIGAQTVEAQGRTAVDIAEEILAALKGEPLRWRVI